MAAGERDPVPAWRVFWHLVFRTGQRRGTVLAAKWDSIDLDAGEWRVDTSIQKARRGDSRQIMVFLSRQLVTALRFQELVLTGDEETVMGGMENPQKTVARVREAAAVRDWHVHDARAWASSTLRHLGTDPDVIDVISISLARGSGGAMLSTTYSRSGRWRCSGSRITLTPSWRRTC
jgi:integrase